MAQIVEISLRIPSLRVKRDGRDAPETIANSDVRFIRQIEVETIPKPGTMLTLTVGAEGAWSFECEVVRSDWHEGKNMFVVACRYSKRSITQAEYQTLLNAPDWQMRALL
jgi:hypothetical protein